MEDKSILGIDLGTSFSRLSIWRNGKVEIIPNENKENKFPSIISFLKNKRLIGTKAEKEISKNFSNTIYNIKRIIGKNYNSLETKSFSQNVPFNIIEGANNKPKIEIEYKGNKQSFFPEEILSYQLAKLKKTAENYLNKEIQNIVISCPSCFDPIQRKSILLAGRIAGINIIRLIKDPIAASISYCYNERLNNINLDEKKLLILDIGGGFVDASIISLDNNIIELNSTKGYNNVGGDDFTKLLLKYCIKEFSKQSKADIKNNLNAINRLRRECDIAKIKLSNSEEVDIDIHNLIDNEDFHITVTRFSFENICEELFNKIISLIEDILFDADLTKDNINEIILLGGSSEIPKLKQILKEFFGKEISNKNKDEESIAIGLAIEGAIIENIQDEKLEKYVLLDICPMSIGVQLEDGKMDKIIDKNSLIPIQKEKKYITFVDEQTEIYLQVFQGESEETKDNKFLANYFISNIPKTPKGQGKIEIKFEVDINGILIITAEEKGEDKRIKLKVLMENDFDEENISEMIQRLKEMERDEKTSGEENECIKLSLGYSLYYGEMEFVIPRNTIIPCSQRIQSLILNHKKIILNVYEGERLLAKENKFLGNCILDDISEKEEKVEIKFSVDINYILKVSLNVNDKNNELRVKLDKLDNENIINEKIKESQEKKEEDKRILENNKMKSNLVNYCFKLKREGNDEEKIKSKITLNWVKTHQNENKEIYEKKLEGLKNNLII